MSEKATPSLRWFDRDRALDALHIEPIPVTRETAAAARQFLREHSGIDLDAFHASVKVELLLSEPLGPTTDCLTADEISQSVRSHMPTPLSGVDLGIVDRVVTHVSNCKHCWSNLEAYQMLEQRSLARAYSAGVENLPAAAWMGPTCQVRQVPLSGRCLEISVLTYRERAPGPFSGSSMKVRVTSPFESQEVPLRQIRTIDPTEMPDRPEAYAQHMKGVVVGVYQSSEIPELSSAQIGTCGYVSIVQEIERKLVCSGRVIRFGKVDEIRRSDFGLERILDHAATEKY